MQQAAYFWDRNSLPREAKNQRTSITRVETDDVILSLSDASYQIFWELLLFLPQALKQPTVNFTCTEYIRIHPPSKRTTLLPTPQHPPDLSERLMNHITFRLQPLIFLLEFDVTFLQILMPLLKLAFQTIHFAPELAFQTIHFVIKRGDVGPVSVLRQSVNVHVVTKLTIVWCLRFCAFGILLGGCLHLDCVRQFVGKQGS